MRKFYLVIVCTLLGCVQMFAQDIVETAYYSAHPELGGDVVINKSTLIPQHFDLTLFIST